MALTVTNWTWYADANQIPPIAQMLANGVSNYETLAGNVVRIKAGTTLDFDANEAGSGDFGLRSYAVDGSVSSYAWDFEGKGITDATTAQASHTYKTPGAYTARLTVTDNHGNVSLAPCTLNVLVTNALEAHFTATRTSGVGPLAVSFDATATTGLAQGDLVNATFSWDFDVHHTDPTGVYDAGQGFVASHVFEKPGTYTVLLTVKDVAGNTSTQEQNITVSQGNWKTYYVAAEVAGRGDGSDANNPRADLVHVLQNLTGPNVRVLLKRGDTFKLTDCLHLERTGPILVDTYGTGAPPKLYYSRVNADWAIMAMPGSDWRVQNLEFCSSGMPSYRPNTAFNLRITSTAAHRITCEYKASPSSVYATLCSVSDDTFTHGSVGLYGDGCAAHYGNIVVNAAAPLLNETFSSGMSNWKTSGGKWAVSDREGGGLCLTQTSSSGAGLAWYSAAGASKWSDYTLEATLRSDSKRGAPWGCSSAAMTPTTTIASVAAAEVARSAAWRRLSMAWPRPCGRGAALRRGCN